MSCAVLILIDGLRPDAISAADCPNLTAFMRAGASTLRAQSVMPSITLPCHMSIFHSVPPQRHGITSNIYTPMARPLPGLIEQIHGEARRSAYFYNWEPLRNLNQPETLQFAFYDNSSLDLEHGDAETVSAFSERMPRELYDFAFLYLGTVDTAGHAFGWMSPDYLQQVSRVDGLVGKALGAVPDDCTVLIMSDHGGHDRSHGTEDPQDMTIPWLLRGPGIRQDYEIAADVSLIDTAPTLASVLDVPPHGAWEGRCIEEVFA